MNRWKVFRNDLLPSWVFAEFLLVLGLRSDLATIDREQHGIGFGAFTCKGSLEKNLSGGGNECIAKIGHLHDALLSFVRRYKRSRHLHKVRLGGLSGLESRNAGGTDS